MRFFIGDLLTGRRIQWLPAAGGDWTETLNGAGRVSCSVPLRDPAALRLDLPNSAAPAKSYLAAVEGDTILQAGPIWSHSYVDSTDQLLTLTAEGMWSYFDRRVILPNTETSPTDPATDTNLTKSYQGMIRYYVEQAQSWTNGDVPVVLPDEISGSFVRNEPGANLAWVGERIRQLTGVEGGPDVQFQPRWNEDRDGVEWVLRIGTPTEPLLYSAQDVVFNASVKASPVSGLRVTTDGAKVATRAYASGGRAAGAALIGVASNQPLLDAGYPALDGVDSSFATVQEQATIDAHATELGVLAGRSVQSIAFEHDFTQRPYLESYTVGDFAQLRVKDHPYLGSGPFRMRVMSRSGRLGSTTVSVSLQPEVDA